MAGYCITRNWFSTLLKTPRVFVLRNELPLRVQVSTSSLKSKPPSILLLTVAGVGAGAILGGGYSFYSINKANSPISNDGIGATSSVIQNFPEVSVSRRVSNMLCNNILV